MRRIRQLVNESEGGNLHKYTVRVEDNPDDHWSLEVDQQKRRLISHLCATPTRRFFLERWDKIMREVSAMDMALDAPIDLIFDYSEAAPVPPHLIILIFTKTLGAATSFPNLHTWRIIPGDPKRNGFFQQVLKAVPAAWMGTMRVSPKIFKSRKEADKFLDEFRANKPRSY
jgi:hypothetical protein